MTVRTAIFINYFYIFLAGTPRYVPEEIVLFIKTLPIPTIEFFYFNSRENY